MGGSLSAVRLVLAGMGSDLIVIGSKKKGKEMLKEVGEQINEQPMETHRTASLHPSHRLNQLQQNNMNAALLGSIQSGKGLKSESHPPSNLKYSTFLPLLVAIL